MPHLIAQGQSPQHRWRRHLAPGREIKIGRTAAGWGIPWDDRVSRLHVAVTLESSGLRVDRIRGTQNPVFFKGKSCDSFRVQIGEHFVVGSTTFLLVDEQLAVTLDAPIPLAERTYSPRLLESRPFLDATRQIDAISRLPDIIAGAGTDEELFVQLTNLLFSAIDAASCVAVVAAPPDQIEETARILHWDRRPDSSTTLAASERLIRRAVDTGQSLVHIWHDGSSAEGAHFTQAGEVDWAFCTPVRGDSCPGWALYVAGAGVSRGSQPIENTNDLQDGVKFTELVAITLAHLRDLRQLERHKSTLGQFISPVVLEAVASRDPETVLAPREANVSVLFCDLRGFSEKSEQSVNDLMGLLNRVSVALGVMTRHILGKNGVIGDFHGDAAMGFWGWPLDQDDRVARACTAALDILAEFTAAQQSEHVLSDFRVGIGMATGTAVAGKIGTVDQVKVTVFGPVVNLAARLEELTRPLQAPILVDETTADILREAVPPTVARLRRVARIRPYGLKTSVEVSQLLPPVEAYPQLTDEHITAYESALDALLSGDWERAFELLHEVPAEDRVKDFLTVFIAQNDRTPPEQWDGVIPMRGKREA